MTELILSDTQQTQTLREVADEFVKARLLTTSDIAGKPTIEVSHEALIREWERLAHWLRDAREDIIIQKHISQAASAWIAKGRRPDDDGLYRGTVLADALEWSRRNIASEEEAAFLHTSAKAEKWRKVEETADTQRMQRTGKVAAMLVPAVILAIVVAIAALWKTSNAQSQMHIARTAQARAEAALATPHGLQVTPFNKKPVALASALQPITLYWQPVIQSFDEVEMVLVPPGCFMMGSEDEEETDFIKRKYSNEQPVHEVCFNNPFWIDRYEVTNEQFEQHEGVASTWSSWSNPSQPRTDIMWFEARDFCASRGGQLPTEAQWEYAARGPESWKYPWGNQFIEDSVVYGGNSGEMPAEVGGRGLGASWVGAIDLSGNVAEWTNTIYNQDQFPYPYSAVDGRELSSDEPDVSYVVRGGSYNLGDFDIRAAIRLHQLAYFSAEVTGFRCARSQ